MAKFQADKKTLVYKEEARAGNKKVAYIHEIPEQKKGTVPLFFLRGYLGRPRDFENARHQTVIRGVEAITMQSTGGLSESQAALLVMRDVEEKTGSTAFNLAPHSWGGTTAAELGNHKKASSYLNTIVFIGSACLADHRLQNMFIRSGRFLSNDLRKAALEKLSTDPAELAINSLGRTLHIARNPWSTLQEGRQAVTGNIQELIQGARDNNIKTAALQFRSDPYSPPEEALAIAHLFDEIQIMDGDHLNLQVRPQIVTPVLLNILSRLDSDDVINPLRVAA